MKNKPHQAASLGQRLSSRLAAFFCFLLLLGVGTYVVQGIEQAFRHESELRARQFSRAIADDLGNTMQHALSVTSAMAAVVRQGRGTVRDFDHLAKELLQQFDGLSALQLVPDGVITQVEPLAGNERVIGFSPLNDPVQGPEVRAVIEHRGLGMTGPFELRQGGLGVVGRLPVFLRDAQGKEYFWGLVQALIRVERIVDAARLQRLEEAGYHYALWRVRPDTGERQVFARSTADLKALPVELSISVPNGRWMLSVAPAVGWQGRFSRWLEVLIVVSISLLGASVVYALVHQPILLRRKVAEQTEALAASETKYRDLVDSAASILLKTDPQGNILFVNEFGLDFFGYTADELIGKPVLGSITPLQESSGRVLAGLIPDVVAAPGRYGEHINENIRKNGERVWISWRNRVNYDSEGNPVEVFCVGADITERIRIESEKDAATRELATRNVWLQSILRHFPGGVLVVDKDLRLIEWNEQFQQLLDFPDTLLGRPGVTLLDLIRFNAERGEYGEVDVDAYMVAIESKIRMSVTHSFERQRPGGSVLEVRGTPFPDGGFVCTYTDITERKQAEAALLAANARYESLNADLEARVSERTRQLAAESHERRTAELALARNERMAALGSLVAGVAHEINTPVGNALMVSTTCGQRIRAFQAMVAEGQLRRSALEGFMADMQKSGDMLERNLHRAAELISNFKQVAVDQTSDRRRVFDLAQTLEEIRMTLQPRYSHSPHRLELEAEAGIRMDSFPGALGQIMTNLSENAFLHAFDETRPGCFRVVARMLEGGWAEIVFADDGSGVPPELIGRIFDPFFTTRLGQGGSGLGLSIVHNLTQDLLGGKLFVESTPGEGTRFTLRIPCVAPDGEAVI